MNFNQLLAFYGVARERSFTRAAKSLAISQPAVTRRIQEMEYANSVKLLERTSRRVVLTEPGKLLLSYVERAKLRFANGSAATCAGALAIKYRDGNSGGGENAGPDLNHHTKRLAYGG